MTEQPGFRDAIRNRSNVSNPLAAVTARRRKSVYSIAMLATAMLAGQGSARSPEGGLTRIDTVCVDARVTRRAVANPTSQKVVSNANGIFLTYLCNSTKGDQQNHWRLMQSTDGGHSFQVLYEETSATKAPTLDTDAEQNLYLCWPDFSTRGPKPRGWLYRFQESERYANPLKVPVPRMMAGKFAAAWDPVRRQVYFWVHSGWFAVLAPDGTVRRLEQIVVHGPTAYLQYPLLCMSRAGHLYAGWTTWERAKPKGRNPTYWDIHAMRSTDGGDSWEKLDGTPLELPQPADNTGATDRISLDDENTVHTWLASMLCHGDKLHFYYRTRNFDTTDERSGGPRRRHFVRFDTSSGQRDVDLYPEFRGDKLVIRGSHCRLAASASVPGSPLYCVGYEDSWLNRCRLVCLASDDNGGTWYDYAASKQTFVPTGVGGCRELTSNGMIIGTFVDLVEAKKGIDIFENKHAVHFFRIQAGLAAADAVRIDRTRVRFSNLRGQPQAVRFKSSSGAWSRWLPMRNELELPDVAATAFQLKSRLDVVSATYAIVEEQAIR